MNRNLQREWDIILIQEPYVTPTGIIRIPNNYAMIYPQDRKKKDADKVRSVIMVSANLNTSSWKEIKIPGNNDITAIQIRTQHITLTIFNLYVDCENLKTITTLRELYATRRREIYPTANAQVIWCGDFNMHHPLWDRDEDHRLFTQAADRRARKLISLVADENMKMTLPKGLPTIRHYTTGNFTRPDNVWSTVDINDRTVRCDVDLTSQPTGTDHYPIVTIIEMPQQRSTPKQSHNFRMADWNKFREELTTKITGIPEPHPITTDEELQQVATNLTKAIQESIQATIKLNSPCPHSKRWWNKDLDDLRKKVNKLSRQSYRNRALPNHESHEAHRKASNEYRDAITKAKTKHWQDFLEEATTNELWTANKYIKEPITDGGRTRVPTIKVKNPADDTITYVDTNDKKAEAFAKSFFPPKPVTSTVPANYDYPEPLPNPPEITIEQIRDQIKQLSSYKASGPDNIPNIVLQKASI